MSEIEKFGFNKDIQKKAKQYESHKLKLSLVVSGLSFLAIIVILQFEISKALKDFAAQYTSQEWMIIALFLLIGYIVKVVLKP